MSKTAFAIIAVLVAVVAAGAYVRFNEHWKAPDTQPPAMRGNDTTLAIDFGSYAPAGLDYDGNPVTFRFGESLQESNRSKTVLGLLLLASGEYNFSVNTVGYPTQGGVLVKSIAGVENGAGGNYWTYEVNGKLVLSPADKAALSRGDGVMWAFGKSPFG